MSHRSERRSRRKYSQPESFTSGPSSRTGESVDDDGEYEVEEEAGPSFLFAVNQLPINDDVPPELNQYQQWLPPMTREGLLEQIPADYLYRWSDDGRISWAEGYERANDGLWYFNGNTQVREYRTSTMFWCNPWTAFLAAPGDVSLRDLAAANHEDHPDQWWPLTFRHEGSLSRIDIAQQEQFIAGAGNWIDRLGLHNYRERHANVSGGLAGNLAMIVALIAFSCEPENLGDVLLGDRAWRNRHWRDHGRRDGRTDCRGVVVTIFLDPENPVGSTEQTIYQLEWSGGRLL